MNLLLPWRSRVFGTRLSTICNLIVLLFLGCSSDGRPPAGEGSPRESTDTSTGGSSSDLDESDSDPSGDSDGDADGDSDDDGIDTLNDGLKPVQRPR